VRTTRRDTLEQIVDRLRVLPIPVLVAWGDHGKVMPVEHGRRLAELVPDGRYVEIPNARVLVQLDEPGHVADLIRSFLIERPGTVGTAAAGRTG